MIRGLFLVTVMIAATPAAGQVAKDVRAPGGFAPMQAPCVRLANGVCEPVTATAPMPVTTRAETFNLAINNTVSPAAALWGGNYVLSQSCTTYGSVILRYRGPDGVTMVTMVTKTTADSGGGTLLAFGTNAIVDVSLSGTAGCNVTLARIP